MVVHSANVDQRIMSTMAAIDPMASINRKLDLLDIAKNKGAADRYYQFLLLSKFTLGLLEPNYFECYPDFWQVIIY